MPAPKEGVLGTVAALLGQRGGKLDTEASREREPERGDEDAFRWQRRYSWAELMKRVFLGFDTMRKFVIASFKCRGSFGVAGPFRSA